MPYPSYHRIKTNRAKFPNAPTNEQILQEVCDILEEDIEKVKGRKRKRDLVFCRIIYGYVALMITPRGLKEIGNLIFRDHTTIIHYEQSVKDWMSTKDEKFFKKWNRYTSLSVIWNEYGNKIAA